MEYGRNLLIHPGMQKTATTLTQKIFTQLSDVLFLGRINGTKSFSSSEILYAHYDLFQPIYKKRDYNWRFTGISRKRIEDYARLIVIEINKSNARNVVLSDEILLSFGEYHAEYNVYLLAQLIECIETMGIVFSNKTLLLTIRDQASWLQSHYSYFYKKWREIAVDEKTLQTLFKENPYSGFFANMQYFEITCLLERCLPGFRLNIVPFELLTDDSDRFVEKLTGGLLLSNAPVPQIRISKVNANSKIDSDGQRANLIKRTSMAGELLIGGGRFIKDILYSVLKENSKLRVKVEQSRNLVIQKISRNGFIYNKEKFILSDIFKEEIRQYFKESNMKLSERYRLDLDVFGYFGCDASQIESRF